MKSQLVLTVCAVTAFAVLIGLGTWQWQRLQWKTALIATIEARVDDEPRSLEEIMDFRQAGRDVEYYPVRVSGTFDHARTVRVYALGNGRAGWHLYTPMKTAEKRYVFVNRGFVPDGLGGSVPEVSEPTGIVEVQGLVRQPPSEKGFFTPANEPEARRFYWRDFSNMVAAIHDKTRVSFTPLLVDQSASGDVGSTSWPRPGTTRVKLANRHRGYVITWYGLALALAAVYAFFMLDGRRRNDRELDT